MAFNVNKTIIAWYNSQFPETIFIYIFICIIPPPPLLEIYLIPQYIRNHCNKGIQSCHKLKICNSFIFATWWCKPLILQTEIKWSCRIDRLKYLKVQDVELQRYKDFGKLNFFIEKMENNYFYEIFGRNISNGRKLAKWCFNPRSLIW